jgi:cell division protein FtsQ
MTRRISGQHYRKGATGSQRFLLKVFLITLIPVILAGTTFLCLSFYLFLKEASFLSLKDVRIEGNRRVPTEVIHDIAELKDEHNILSINIRGLKSRLAQHPWIEKALIKRVFPDGIRIVIRERQPVAVIHLGKLYYVDQNGVVFDQAEGRERGAYPILTGLRKENLETGDRKTRMLLRAALRFLNTTQDNRILSYRSISQIHLDGAVGLLVYTTDRGTEFRMGFGGFQKKLKRLSRIWPDIRTMELSSIDCTVPRKIIVNKRGETG